MRERTTYAELLEVVDGQVVAEHVEESILEHAAVAVATRREPKVNKRTRRIVVSRTGAGC